MEPANNLKAFTRLKFDLPEAIPKNLYRTSTGKFQYLTKESAKNLGAKKVSQLAAIQALNDLVQDHKNSFSEKQNECLIAIFDGFDSKVPHRKNKIAKGCSRFFNWIRGYGSKTSAEMLQEGRGHIRQAQTHLNSLGKGPAEAALLESLLGVSLEELEQEPGKVMNYEEGSEKQWFQNSIINAFAAPLIREYPDLGLPTAGAVDTHAEGVDVLYHLNTVKEYLIEHGLNCQKNQIAYHLQASRNHWVLLFIDRENRILECYDSFARPNEVYAEIADELTRQDVGEPYKVLCKITKPLQKDGYQCGPWVCFFLEQRLKEPDFDFNSLHQTLGPEGINEMIALYRKKVILRVAEFQNLWADWQRKMIPKFENLYGEDTEGGAIIAYLEKRQAKDPVQLINEICEGLDPTFSS